MAWKCVFNQDWKNPRLNPAWASWVDDVPDNKCSVRCLICKTTFSLSNMGKLALVSHERGTKHKRNIISLNVPKALTMDSFLKKPAATEDTIHIIDNATSLVKETEMQLTSGIAPENNSLQKNVGLKYFQERNDVTRAEIVWCLYTVLNHHSTRSAGKAVEIFKYMFPDSSIALKLRLQKDKISYTICYGLAPFFQQELLQILSTCKHFVISFDESLNKVSQQQQMDIVVRFWNEKLNEVTTRYLNSCFLGHTTAVDLLEGFKSSLLGLNMAHMLQVSMDGPSVNWKFLNDLKLNLRSEPTDPILLDLGSCGLHVIHGALKTGITSTGWNVIGYLRAIYNLLKNVPARRADYIKCSGLKIFPLKFCSVRWVENAKVAERAIEITSHIVKYVNEMKKQKQEPTCASFRTIESCLKDKLLIPKLSFFLSLASEVEPFLKAYQTNEPLVPFLYEELHCLLRSMLTRFVKKDTLDSADSATKVIKIDLTENENLILPHNIDIGFSTRAALKTCKSVSQLEVLQFRSECLTCLIKFSEKIMEKSPLKYKMTKGSSCLSPKIFLDERVGSQRLSIALDLLIDRNWISGPEADNISREYKNLSELVEVQNLMKAFSRKTDRLDNLWWQVLNDHGKEGIIKFAKIILVLSHGNAAVERGFSVNSDCLVENLKEETLVSQRIVYDAVTCAGGISKINVSSGMIQFARNANANWKEALKKKRESEKTELKKMTERKRASMELKILQEKKRKLVSETSETLSVLNDDMKMREKIINDL